jgi:hypothetical protein
MLLAFCLFLHVYSILSYKLLYLPRSYQTFLNISQCTNTQSPLHSLNTLINLKHNTKKISEYLVAFYFMILYVMLM